MSIVSFEEYKLLKGLADSCDESKIKNFDKRVSNITKGFYAFCKNDPDYSYPQPLEFYLEKIKIYIRKLNREDIKDLLSDVSLDFNEHIPNSDKERENMDIKNKYSDNGFLWSHNTLEDAEFNEHLIEMLNDIEFCIKNDYYKTASYLIAIMAFL